MKKQGFIMLLFFLTSCIPIPVKKEFLKRPDISICVYKNDTPMQQIPIVYLMHEYPYNKYYYSDTTLTSSNGCAFYSKKIEEEVVYPYMMHGVHQYSFQFVVLSPIDTIHIYYDPISDQVGYADAKDFTFRLYNNNDSNKVKKLSSSELLINLNR